MYDYSLTHSSDATSNDYKTQNKYWTNIPFQGDNKPIQLRDKSTINNPCYCYDTTKYRLIQDPMTQRLSCKNCSTGPGGFQDPFCMSPIDSKDICTNALTAN